MALQAGQMVGSDLLSAVVRKSDNAPDSWELQERCDELLVGAPGIVELRMAARGQSVWRQLRLENSNHATRWYVMADGRNGNAGWRPMESFLIGSFTSALQQKLKQGRLNYVIYAPSEPLSTAEQNQLVALAADFGGSQGTLRWKGRDYEYTVVDRLPCFPGPIVVKRQHG